MRGSGVEREDVNDSPNLGARMSLNTSLSRLQLTYNQFYQCRLSFAIFADETDARSWVDHK